MKLVKPSSVLIVLLTFLGSISCTAQKEKTSFMEASLYKFSQETLLSEMKEDKKALMKKLKMGDKSAEKKIAKLTSRQRTVESILADLPEDVRINDAPYLLKIEPKPPCPPKDCEGLKELSSIVVGKEIKKVTAVVLDAKGKKIGTLGSKPLTQDMSTGYKEFPFNLKKNFTGPVTIQVTRTPFKGKPTTYNYQAVLQ